MIDAGRYPLLARNVPKNQLFSKKTLVCVATSSTSNSIDLPVAYTQLDAGHAIPKPSLSHDDADDDDIDELASSNLINVPDHHYPPTSSKHDILPPAPTRTEGFQDPQQTSAKPLPPLPSSRLSNDTESGKAKLRVLGPKSTNQKIFSTGSKVSTKPKISSPVLISSADPFGRTAAAGPFDNPSLSLWDTTTSSLTRQAEAQAAETKAKEKELAAVEASFRPSPLQRGRSVLTTAKHAIASRLSSPHIKLRRFKTPLSRGLSNPGYATVNQTSEPIRVLPQPLPVYESMRSRRESPEPLDDHDPFSDKMEMDDAWSDFDFEPRKDKVIYDEGSSSPRTSFSNVANETTGEQLLVQSKGALQFSNKISGLRQHPNPELFSSSPVGFSTPRVRLESTADANGKKRLSTVFVRDPSLHDSSIGRESTDDEDDPLIRNGNEAVHGSSMKRKSATEDLHSLAWKRAKTDSGASGGTAVLAQNFDQLGTNDGHSMQGIQNMTEDAPPVKQVSPETGFGLFDMGKGKEVESRFRDSVESLSIRRHSRQHSSSGSRPTSVLFSRESRARVPLLNSYKEDRMDVDELQMDDPLAKT
ncbi:MAG: hypothetical protein Q9223_001111 [Gallowayella weberi]